MTHGSQKWNNHFTLPTERKRKTKQNISVAEKTAMEQSGGVTFVVKMGVCFTMRSALELSKYGTTGITFCLA